MFPEDEGGCLVNRVCSLGFFCLQLPDHKLPLDLLDNAVHRYPGFTDIDDIDVFLGQAE